MIVGLTGKAFSGKSTLFNTLLQSGENADAKGRRIGMVTVPDNRIKFLSSVFKPKKTTYSSLQIEEMPGNLESSKELASLLGELRRVDAICLVLGAFTDPEKSPLDDLQSMLDEFKIADLILIEKRLDRLKKEGSKSRETEFLRNFQSQLENACSTLRGFNWDKEQISACKGFRFLTQKPVIAVINQAESRFRKKRYPDLEVFAENNQVVLLEMCAQLEMEIAQLDLNDKASFLQDLGLEQEATMRFIRILYDLLNFISFFTVGSDEVKAWNLTRGSSALEAAGKIHSDIQRGFIRAEVISYTDFADHGSEKAVRDAGKAPLEGKNYIVKDGDIIHFKFNV